MGAEIFEAADASRKLLDKHGAAAEHGAEPVSLTRDITLQSEKRPLTAKAVLFGRERRWVRDFCPPWLLFRMLHDTGPSEAESLYGPLTLRNQPAHAGDIGIGILGIEWRRGYSVLEPIGGEQMMKRIGLASVFLVLAAQAPASAADYPLRHDRVVRSVSAPVAPTCYRARWAYVRYVPVLATRHWITPVYIEYPVPCGS